MNKLVIVTTNFQSIIESLRANIKLGYGVLHKIEIVNEHYRAELLQGDDKVYQSRLDHFIGGDVGTEDVLRWLSGKRGGLLVGGDPFSKFVEKVMVDIPVEAVSVEGTTRGSVNTTKEDVNTTIKRTRKTKEKKV